MAVEGLVTCCLSLASLYRQGVPTRRGTRARLVRAKPSILSLKSRTATERYTVQDFGRVAQDSGLNG